MILWLVKYIFISIYEIEVIEEIEIIKDFKYIIRFEYQKMCDISHSIEEYCKSNHDWNTLKDNWILSFIDILELRWIS